MGLVKQEQLKREELEHQANVLVWKLTGDLDAGDAPIEYCIQEITPLDLLVALDELTERDYKDYETGLTFME